MPSGIAHSGQWLRAGTWAGIACRPDRSPRCCPAETRRFEGDFDIYDLDLTFTDPIPTFTPTPSPTPAPTAVPTALTLIPETGLATAVTGVGFASDSLVTLTSGGITLGTVSTDRTGAFRMVIAAPSSVAGEYEVTSTDEEGTSSSVTLTVPDLTGPNGETGALGLTGPGGIDGIDGNQGAAGPTGNDASLVLPVVALVLAGLGILIIITIYLYLISWYRDLARRLPPPGIR